jgi:chromosome segregation ATPase
MVFFLIIGIVLVAVRATSYRLTPVVGSIKEKEDVPFDLVEGFVRFYQEKTAIRQRMNDLDSKRGRLKKGDYDKQKQTLESKATNTDRDLMKYTQTLSDKGGRYREAVRQIEIAEATLDDILRNITDLNKKKRQKRIRSEIHARLLDDYTKKLKRANTTIERVLVDLRSLLTEKS